MAYRDFVNDRRKGVLRDVLLFYGAEDYLMNWAVERIIEDNVGKECADKVADIIRQYTEKIIRENEANPQGMTFYINNDGKHIS